MPGFVGDFILHPIDTIEGMAGTIGHISEAVRTGNAQDLIAVIGGPTVQLLLSWDTLSGDCRCAAIGQIVGSKLLPAIAGGVGLTKLIKDLRARRRHRRSRGGDPPPAPANHAVHRNADGGPPRNPDGTFAPGPNGPNRHTRQSEYPHDLRSGTRERVIDRHRDPNTGQVRDPVSGNPIPEDRIDIDHHPQSVQDHWDNAGRNQSRAQRNDWYNDDSNLRVRERGPNRSEGARGPRFRQDTGPNYSP